MSAHERHNNYKKGTLMGFKKDELADYALHLQAELLKALVERDRQAEIAVEASGGEMNKLGNRIPPRGVKHVGGVCNKCTETKGLRRVSVNKEDANGCKWRSTLLLCESCVRALWDVGLL